MALESQLIVTQINSFSNGWQHQCASSRPALMARQMWPIAIRAKRRACELFRHTGDGADCSSYTWVMAKADKCRFKCSIGMHKFRFTSPVAMRCSTEYPAHPPVPDEISAKSLRSTSKRFGDSAIQRFNEWPTRWRLDQCPKAANYRVDPPTSQNINMLMRGSGHGRAAAGRWLTTTTTTATATVHGDLWVQQMLYGVSLWLIYLRTVERATVLATNLFLIYD